MLLSMCRRRRANEIERLKSFIDKTKTATSRFELTAFEKMSKTKASIDIKSVINARYGAVDGT